jgi:Raf kinase inhibitor-like YbhB/YbcL family protein
LLGAELTIATSAFGAPQKLSVTTSSFPKGGTIPSAFTCQGMDISPQLSWTKVPPKTKSFAVVLSDPDAPGGTFYHWGVYNIPSTVTSFIENVAVVGAQQATNDFRYKGYNGPCPPSGKAHRYIFTVYALSKASIKATSAGALLKNLTKGSLKKFVLASGTVNGKYKLQASEEEQCYDNGGTWSCSTFGEQTSCTCRL